MSKRLLLSLDPPSRHLPGNLRRRGDVHIGSFDPDFLVHIRVGLDLLRLVESRRDGDDHAREPVVVQSVEHEVRAQVDGCEPQRHLQARERVRDHLLAAERLGGDERLRRGGRRVRVYVEDVAEDLDREVGSPEDAAAEEAPQQEEAVDQLVDRARQVKFVAEPVDVKERAGELKEDEDGRVVVYKWALWVVLC